MPACRRTHTFLAIAAAALALVGCTTSSTGSSQSPGDVAEVEFNDPLEDVNRSIFRFNQVVDEVVLVPVAKGYRTAVPSPMRASVYDFLRNLNGPVILANDVLQGQPRLAAQTLARLTINTTVGFGGMFDVAGRIGIPHHSNDMGSTFATYGVGEGPYLVAPVLGPTNPRDLVGRVGDSFIDPITYVVGNNDWWYVPLSRTAVSGVDVRSRNIEALADIEKTSLDFYATIRSLFRQRRAAEIRHEDSNLPNPTISPSSEGGRNPAVSPYFATPSTFREFSAK
jgi:phospholipid-binding lipoprotein MlaA